MTRASVSGAERVVVKVGSSSLTTAAGGIDPERVRLLVDSLAGVRRRGADLVLVSSGAIAAGLSPLAFKRRPRDLARQQAAASVGGLSTFPRPAVSYTCGLGIGSSRFFGWIKAAKPPRCAPIREQLTKACVFRRTVSAWRCR